MAVVPIEDLPSNFVPVDDLPTELSNIVPENDLPDTILNKQKSMTEKVSRGLSTIARGAAIPATGAALGGALAGPPGAIAGSLVLPAAELVSKGLGLAGIETGSPYALAQRGLTKLGFPEPQTTTERALQAGGEALGGVGGQIGALSKLATTAVTPAGRNIAAQLSALPERQLAASIPAGATAQAVGEKTESPTLGMLAGVGASLPFGIRAPKQTEKIPTIDELKQLSRNQYQQAKEAGIVFKKDSFKSFANQLEKDLIEEGLDKDIQPTAFKALNRITTAANKANTLSEIETLRKVAQGASASTNASERMFGQKMIERLDDYIETSSPENILAGDKAGIDAIRNAREAWRTSKKAEIMDDIFNSAELRAEANYNVSGMENVLRRKLVNLADNKKLMRTFTKDEQEAIIKAAKGGTMQNFYRRIGKYAPTGVISTTFGSGLGGAAGAAVGGIPGAFVGGVAIPAIGAAARRRATNIGIQEFQKLEDMLRLGRAPRPQPTTGQILGTRAGLMGLEQGLLQPLE